MKRQNSRTIRTTAKQHSLPLYQQLELRRLLAGADPAVCYSPVLSHEAEYDTLGRLTFETTVYDNNLDGVGDQKSVSRFSYSEENGLTTTVMVNELDWNNDGQFDAASSTETVTDAEGRVLTQLHTSDYEANGQTDYRFLQTWAYDENGQPISIRTDQDHDADGTWDETNEELLNPEGQPEPAPAWDVQEEYDGDGRLTRVTTRQDLDLDGTWDRVDTSSYTWDEQSRLVAATEERDLDADGTADYRAVATNEYDADGNLVAIHHEVDENGDGIVDLQRTDTIELPDNQLPLTEYVEERDSEDRLVRTTTRTDIDRDGAWDQTATSNYTWREDSQIAIQTDEQDYDADGTADYRSVATYEYDADGIQVAVHIEVDSDGDGTVDDSYTINALPLFNPAFAFGPAGGEAARNEDLSGGGSGESAGLNLMAVSFSVTDEAFALDGANPDDREQPGPLSTTAADSLALAGAFALSQSASPYEPLNQNGDRRWRAGQDQETAGQDPAEAKFLDSKVPSIKALV
jgi:hypothetical protein